MCGPLAMIDAVTGAARVLHWPQGRTPVAGGAIDHRDLVLSAAEKAGGQWIMPCVSRAAAAQAESGEAGDLELRL